MRVAEKLAAVRDPAREPSAMTKSGLDFLTKSGNAKYSVRGSSPAGSAMQQLSLALFFRLPMSTGEKPQLVHI